MTTWTIFDYRPNCQQSNCQHYHKLRPVYRDALFKLINVLPMLNYYQLNFSIHLKIALEQGSQTQIGWRATF
jgi:hypothetical protein